MNNDKLLHLTKKYINLQKLSLDNVGEECTLARQKAEVILEEIKTLSPSLHTHLVSISSDKTKLSFYADNVETLRPYMQESKTGATCSPLYGSRGDLLFSTFLHHAFRMVGEDIYKSRPLDSHKEKVLKLAEETRAWVESLPNEFFENPLPSPPIKELLELFDIVYQSEKLFDSLPDNRLQQNGMMGMNDVIRK